MDTPPVFRRPGVAALVGAPTGFFGGLIGLASSEFRLPFLITAFNYTAHQAVPINLAVSLITLSTSLVIRIWGTAAIPPAWPVVVPMMIGGLVGAYGAAALVSTKISERSLRTGILVLLMAVGAVLVIEAVTGERSLSVTFPAPVAAVVAAALGAVFGALRSILGTSGSVMPAFIILFGFDVNVAATATMIVNLPAAVIGAARYARGGYLSNPLDWTRVILPMGAASAVFAVAGVSLANAVSPQMLRIALGSILVVTSLVLIKRRPAPVRPDPAGHATIDSGEIT